MTSEESEREARAGAASAGVPDSAGDAAETTATAATNSSVETVAGAAATPETLAGAATTPETLTGAAAITPLAGAATPAAIHPTGDPAAGDARDPTLLPSPSPPPLVTGAHIGSSLETIKTAVVWLVVIQILTILSPLLHVSLKWALIVGLVLTLSSFAVAAVAYLKALRAQRSLPE